MSDSQGTPTPPSDETIGETPTLSGTAIRSDDGAVYAEAVPVPRRYRWLKRITVVGVAWPAVLFGLHAWWGWDSDRRLQNEIDRIVASGEPIYPQDFDPKETLRDEDNAAAVYTDAAAGLVLTSVEHKLVSEVDGNIEVVSANLSEIRTLVEKNREVLRLVRQASVLTRADWGVRMRTPMFSVLLPGLGSQRNLSRFILVTSLLRFKEGDSREALAMLEDAIASARIVDAHPSLTGHFVAIAEFDVVWRTIEASLPRLEIAGEREGLAKTAVSRTRITDLIERLLDEDALQAAHILAMQTERALLIDTICAVADGRISPWAITGGRGPRWITPLVIRAARPAMNEDALFALRRLDRVVLAARQATWPRASATLPPPYPQWSGIDVWLHYCSAQLVLSRCRAILLHYRAVAMRRMARIALAIRLYEIDYGGRPASLGNLVPEYLPALPADPFGDGERVFGYLPDAVRPRLYSVGPNGVDDGGDVAFAGRVRINKDLADMPFFLDGSRPKTAEELNTPAAAASTD